MNYQTCYALIKREYYESRSSIFWIFLLTLMLLFIQSLPAALTAGPVSLPGLESIKMIYISLGTIIASYAFWEFKLDSNTQSYLLIPANPLEKIIAKLIFYILGWLILFMVCFLVANILTIFLANLVIPQFIALNSSQNYLQLLLHAILIQSIAFFTSCYFKRKVLIKLVCAYMLFILPFEYCYNLVSIYIVDHEGAQYSSSLIILAQICTILGLWALTWLRLKETEAK